METGKRTVPESRLRPRLLVKSRRPCFTARQTHAMVSSYPSRPLVLHLSAHIADNAHMQKQGSRLMRLAEFERHTHINSLRPYKWNARFVDATHDLCSHHATANGLRTRIVSLPRWSLTSDIPVPRWTISAHPDPAPFLPALSVVWKTGLSQSSRSSFLYNWKRPD